MSKAILALMLLLPLSARAADAPQAAAPEPESITVTGTRSHEVIEKFVKSFATVGHLTGKITRWEDGVCPITVGLNSAAVKFVNDRLRAVAAEAGAPVNGKSGCLPNIEIVFTTKPQGLLDTVRKERPQLLGFAYTGAQQDALAKVSRPIQAWYTTETRDLRGNITIDLAHHSGLGIELPCNCEGGGTIVLPDANAGAVTGTRLGDGMRSDFYHVIVVADPTRLADHDMGELADYIALLALSQVAAPDACQPLPSVVNAIIPGCAEPSATLSPVDLAWLKGLYRMNPGRNLRTQEDQIASEIEAEATGQ